MHSNDSLELLTRYGHADPADEAVIDAAAMAVLAASVLRPAPQRRSFRARRTLIAATSVAAAAAVAVTAISLATSTSNTSTPASHAAVPLNPTARQPTAPGHETILARLASAVLASPAPAGDATLVLRSQGVGANGVPVPGADLYTDSGKYYYAPTEAGLPAQVSAGNNQGDGIFAREIAAATHAATTGDLTSAAEEMETAPSPSTAAPPQGGPLANDWLWENSMNALVAGSGNPTVRAGVMRLISTISEVTVTNATVAGKPAVRITAAFPGVPKCTAAQAASSAKLREACASLAGSGYQEQWTIDATTGIPISFAGGALGQPPAAVTTYQVSRVTLAQVAQGHFVVTPTTSTPGA